MPESRSCLPYLQLAIMLLLNRRGPLCGYRIAVILNKLGLRVDESAVYTALSKMRRRGLVRPLEVRVDGRRVVRYELTGRGVEELENLLGVYRLISRAIEAIESGVS